ncbi:MAG: FHA domain-containing protein [Clostridiales bacterium]|jgi:uncharacterized RDD family membrane protein YckC|nr:FHA domain-containing protein [Clostridiales bacterium]
MKKASIGIRFLAMFLDGIFIQIILGVLLFVNPVVFGIVLPFGTLLYYGIFEGSSMSATLGKKICSIVVVTTNGQKLSMGTSFLRALGRLLSSLIFGIGYLIALFNDQNQAMHDKLAGTLVVTADSVIIPVGVPVGVPVNQGGNGMNPQIVCVSGPFAGRAFPVTPQGILLGRDATACDITFGENIRGISRIHAKVAYNPQTRLFVLYDMGSTYGTFNSANQRIPQGQPNALRPGEEFYLASRDNLFRASL